MSEEKEEKLSVKETKELLAKITEENQKTRELIEKLERLKAEDTISGKSEAGIEPKKISKEEEERKAAMSLVEGTGLNPFD